MNMFSIYLLIIQSQEENFWSGNLSLRILSYLKYYEVYMKMMDLCFSW